ncbi:hypothetical protein FHY52_12315 [Nocardia nova]|uniref:caspase family protein n=1 Tax=Nocardia nova TaxID=37330 RepID=UPI0025C9600C|nr:hypothetical protein [Nocardia nova]
MTTMRLPNSARSRAVLIGTSSYSDTSGFASLPSVIKSLTEFERLLREQTGLTHVHVVADPDSREAFIDALRPAADEATDLLLFYFAGHGVALRDDVGLTYTLSRAAQPEWSSVAYAFIRDEIQRSSAAVKMVILDCCHSGKAFGAGTLAGDPGEALKDLAVVEGTYVLTATDTKTKFAKATGPEGCTAFTGALIDVLRSGTTSPDEYISMAALFPLLQTKLRERNFPTPKSSGRDTGAQLALVRNTRKISAPADQEKPKLPATAPAADVAPRDSRATDGSPSQEVPEHIPQWVIDQVDSQSRRRSPKREPRPTKPRRPGSWRRLTRTQIASGIVVLLIPGAIWSAVTYLPRDFATACASQICPSSTATNPNVSRSSEAAGAPQPIGTPGLAVGVDRALLSSGEPHNQDIVVLQPWFANNTSNSWSISRSELRVFVSDKNFNVAAWYQLTTDTPVHVQLGSTGAWAVPLNRTHAYEPLPPTITWATIFYGIDELTTKVYPPNSANTVEPWQLAFYIPAESEDEFLGFGVLDDGLKEVAAFVPASKFPASTCPCDWWR